MTRRGTIARWAVAAIAAALLAAVVLGALYVRGGGPVPGALAALARRQAASDPLAASDARESVLRTLRLAGIARAVVGDAGGVALVRLEVPQVSSAADVELAWITGAGALAGAYPEATRYVVQVYAAQPAAGSAPGAPLPLLEVKWDGATARKAAKADDAKALREAAQLRVLSREASK